MSKSIPTKKEGKEFYDQADVIPAKWLMPDGSIVDELPIEGAGSDVDLEDNHQTTINVSEYTEPVEITPTAGKDGMKKNTITLSNIPSGDNVTFYAWREEGEENLYFTMSNPPSVGDKVYNEADSGGAVYPTTPSVVDSVGVDSITVGIHTLFRAPPECDLAFSKS